MTTAPSIPFGFKQVSGQTQKGDGVWDGTKFRKVKREYPRTDDERVFIRRCEVVQPALPMRKYLEE